MPSYNSQYLSTSNYRSSYINILKTSRKTSWSLLCTWKSTTRWRSTPTPCSTFKWREFMNTRDSCSTVCTLSPIITVSHARHEQNTAHWVEPVLSLSFSLFHTQKDNLGRPNPVTTSAHFSIFCMIGQMAVLAQLPDGQSTLPQMLPLPSVAMHISTTLVAVVPIRSDINDKPPPHMAHLPLWKWLKTFGVFWQLYIKISWRKSIGQAENKRDTVRGGAEQASGCAVRGADAKGNANKRGTPKTDPNVAKRYFWHPGRGGGYGMK